MLKNIVLSAMYIALYSFIMTCLLHVESSMPTVYVGVYMAMIMFTIVFINMSKDQINLTVLQLREWVGTKWN
ncbi:hypothetical protein vBAbaMD22_144 [Acinetobacter phage vB_AbaM_D22]|nr:hypothetical protein vBAbaMD22_144 [Acinetobacter phage vB_AbaM_D22]